MNTKNFDRTFYNDNNFKITQVCNKCGDAKFYHPINLCYNYEPKFNQVKKEIVKPISWSNYFKSYFVEIKPEIEITYEPIYCKYNTEPFDSGKAYCSSNLSDYIGGISPNFPFKTSNLPETGCTNTQSTRQSTPVIKVNWLFLDKLEYRLEYILNGMWIDVANYIYKNVYNILKPVKYINETQMKVQMDTTKYQMKNEIEQMKNTIENMKTQMLSDLKHKIEYEFLLINRSDNNCKVLIDKITDKLENTEINLDELNLINHKQKTKLLMEDIKSFSIINKLNKNQDIFLQSIANIKKLKNQDTDIIDCDYEKIEA